MFVGGDYIYAVIFIIISIFISYNLYLYYSISKKSLLVNNKVIKINSDSIIFKYFENINSYLENLGRPYGLTLNKYIVIKYFLSIALSVIMYFNSKNLFMSLILLILIFILPNILVNIYKKSESNIIVEEISNIVQNLILALVTDMNLYNSLKSCVGVINYTRLKDEYEKFVENYMLYNFNLSKAVNIISNKFYSFEFGMFLSILSQGEKEGKIVDLLEVFLDSIELMYFKTLKQKTVRRTMYIVLITVVILVNSLVIVLFPIMSEVSTSFTNLFK